MSDSYPTPGNDKSQNAAGAGADDGAFGFQADAKEEKYNTQYIVASLAKDRMRTRLIIAGTLAAAVLGVLLWMALSPKSEPKLPPMPAANAVPAEPPAAATPTLAPAPLDAAAK